MTKKHNDKYLNNMLKFRSYFAFMDEQIAERLAVLS